MKYSDQYAQGVMNIKIGDRVEVRGNPDGPNRLPCVVGTVIPFSNHNENPGYCAVLLDEPVNGCFKYLVSIDDCSPYSIDGKFNRPKAEKSRKESVFNQSNGRCFYCGVAVVKYDESTDADGDVIFNIDHKTPLSRGGSNRKDNLICSCRKCNLSKGRLTVEEFRAKKQKKNDPESPALTFLKKAIEVAPTLTFKEEIEAQIKLIEDRIYLPLVFAGEVKS